MMKVRKHRGMFDESMDTMQEIEPTWEAIEKYFQYPRSMIDVIDYSEGRIDDRKGWEATTYLVCLKSGGVLGMSSEEIK